jgi:hypothetical protein
MSTIYGWNMTNLRRLSPEELADCEMMCGMMYVSEESPTVFMCVLHEGHDGSCMPQFAAGVMKKNPTNNFQTFPKPRRIK